MHNKKLRKKFDLEHSSCKPSQIREVQPCFTISSFVNSIQRSVNITIKKGTQTGYWWELNMKKQLDICSLQEIIIMIISWGYFPLSVAEKNRFFFKLIKLN